MPNHNRCLCRRLVKRTIPPPLRPGARQMDSAFFHPVKTNGHVENPFCHQAKSIFHLPENPDDMALENFRAAKSFCQLAAGVFHLVDGFAGWQPRPADWQNASAIPQNRSAIWQNHFAKWRQDVFGWRNQRPCLKPETPLDTRVLILDNGAEPDRMGLRE